MPIPGIALSNESRARRVRRIQPYPVLLYCGLVAGILVATRWAGAHALDAARVNAALLILVLPALAGARLLYVATHWERFRHDIRRIWRKSDGGAALYGALLVAVALSVPLLRVLDVPFAGFWDAASIAMLTGMIFARAGCLLAGCCSGRAFGIPVQVVEAVLAALVLAVSPWIGARQGSMFLFALGSYGVARWVLEGLRDTVDRVRGVSVNRAISGVLAAFAAVGWWLLYA